MLRLSLENGAYGFYINADEERWNLWISRNDDASTKQKVRNEFTQGKIKSHIKKSSQKLGEHYETLYDQLIDFGAHPNEQGFSLSSNFNKEDGDIEWRTTYLHGEGLALDLGLKTAGQVGLWVLHVAQLVYPERFQVLQIRYDLEEIRSRF